MSNGPYARISVLRPHDGDTVDFEAGYIRHLDWHRQNNDTWTWYGWTVWAGERQRWFVYATFGHSAAEMDGPVDPAGDERDNISNVTPHAHFVGSALYEFLPALSHGTGVPTPTARLELTTVDLVPGGEEAFEAALCHPERSEGPGRAGGAPPLPPDPSLALGMTETLWYRMIAGGPVPRYLRLRPRPNLSALLDDKAEQAFPDAKTTVEILNLRPAMCYGVR